MTLTMLDTRLGTDDGFTIERFHAGQSYTVGEDIGGSLAGQFIRRGQAVVTQRQTFEEAMAGLMGELVAAQESYRDQIEHPSRES